jgi:aspartyl-tRNA(Asn)/glutamyl-tRNA(Gln) amidotransferase subunit A
MYLADLFTVQANITGNPAISIPLGKSSLGLPIGVQLMTQRKAEHDLYDLAQLIERVNS